MITRETAARIWNAYREIETGEAMLEDMKKERERLDFDERAKKHAPTLKDAFGRVQHLQLGIPIGNCQHKLLDVHPVLAESIIRAHIERKRAELSEANECARVELGL